MATATKTKATFGVSCPKCGASEAIRIDLNCLAGPLACEACSEEFTAVEARATVADQLKRWDAVCRWIEMAAGLIAE